ncbi:MAG: hypothetical protein JEY91_03650 [Spirochaetaceae bacterium]|nr:hypothetical protein [Spirochaetaceae bacterium]
MNRLIICFLLFLTSSLFSLEIRLNGELFENFSQESIELLSYKLPDSEFTGIFLYELLPLMEETYSFRFLSEDFLMETDPDKTLYISNEETILYLQNSAIGKIPLPGVIEIEGIVADTEKMTIWFDEEDLFLQREIDLFGRLHRIEIEYRVEKDLTSLLEYNVFNQTQIPDLIVYTDKKLNRLSPLLSPLSHTFSVQDDQKPNLSIGGKLLALPFKFSRPVFLENSSGGENRHLTSDFGNLDFLYPLFTRFGLEGGFSIDSAAVRESFFYLTGLYKQGIYKLSADPHEDFLEGRIDSVYTSSTILGEISRDPYVGGNRSLPQLGGENPPPLLSYKLLSLPSGHQNSQASQALLYFLTAYGVQQRINPRTGYLPYNNQVYELIPQSINKFLLMENLENATTLGPDETWDKLRFVLPKISRLIITGRLTIDEGLKEIQNFMENQN